MKKLYCLLLLQVTWVQPLRADQVEHLVDRALAENPKIKAGSANVTARVSAARGSGFLPDPMFSVNYFGSPIETRNGPQRMNFMLKQPLPWPSGLSAQTEMAEAASSKASAAEKRAHLNVSFAVRKLAYQHALTVQKLDNLYDLEKTLQGLNKVITGRLKVGKASLSDQARVAVEQGKLKDSIQRVNQMKTQILAKMAQLVGGTVSAEDMPKAFDDSWYEAPSSPVSNHPDISAAQARRDAARAKQTLEENKYLPKLAATFNYFKIDPVDSPMADDPGKDAWAIGAQITIPIWFRKYGSLSDSAARDIDAANANAVNVRTSLDRDVNVLRSEISAQEASRKLFREDIIPQATRALEIDQRAYSQNAVAFDRIVDDALRLLRLKNQGLDIDAKLATLCAQLMERLGQVKKETI